MSQRERATAITRRRRGLLGGAAALLVAGLLAGANWSRLGRAGPPERLRLALASTPHAALLHLAAAKGFFEEEGLAVSLIPVSHGKAALDLLSRGEADLAAAAEVPFVIAVLQGERFEIAASMLGVSNEMAVVARRDRGIAQASDLLGKRVGVTQGTSGEYFLWAFLIRHKLPPDGVTLVDLPPGRIVDELAQGRIDAASTWQPVRVNAESALGAQAASFTAPAAYTVTHVVVGGTDYLRAHPSATRKLVRALVRAEQYNRSEPEAALALAARQLKLDPAALAGSWRDLGFRVNLLQSHLVTLEDEARWAVARGHVPPRPIPNFLAHLYLDALLAEQPERVTVVH